MASKKKKGIKKEQEYDIPKSKRKSKGSFKNKSNSMRVSSYKALAICKASMLSPCIKEKEWLISSHDLSRRPHAKLPFSVYYLSREQIPVILDTERMEKLLRHFVNVLQENKQLEGVWISHALASAACGYSTKSIEEARRQFGNFAWAPEFENYHCSFWNFKEQGFSAEGVQWNGPEQYYHSFKLKAEYRTQTELQRLSKMDDEGIYKWGTNLSPKKFRGTKEWDTNRVCTMRQVIKRKFEENGAVQILLDSTKGIKLVSIKNDNYWGFPGNNMLAHLLQEWRDNK